MKIEKLIVENFRQYFGRQRMEFARDDDKCVTIIHGVNGAGKTSLFIALNWCLYEEGASNIGELISKEAISRANAGELIQASVELTLRHNAERYVVRRSLQGVKGTNGKIEGYPTASFTMMRIRGDGQAERIPNPVGTINSILPSNVRTYFLFDGEKIDNFAKPEAASEIKSAVFLILKLEVLDRAKQHLKAVAQDYRHELKRLSSGELRNLIERDEAARAAQERETASLARFKQDVESAKRKIADIDQKLREQQNAQNLQEKRDRIERDLKQRRGEHDGIVSNIRDAATSAYTIAAQPAIAAALRVLDEKRERGEIPSSIRKQFVEDLIEQMSCICGRSFTEGSPEHTRLLALVRESLPGSLEDDVLATTAALRSCEERAARGVSDLDTLMKHRTELVDIINALEAELDDIGRQLKDSPLEEISRMEKARQDFLADIDSYNVQIGSTQNRLSELAAEISNLEKAIAQARKEEKRERTLGDKLELAQAAADAISEIYEAFADETRARIEAKTKEIFKLLVWKDAHFQDVRLSSDFNLEVIDRYEQPARPELSAGERQVLSLSFITAMSRISDEEAPLIMDTPFGRLSSQPRNNITAHLPELADQLVLFVTDEELRDQSRQNLEPRIGAEYRLEFNPQTSCTEIVEVTKTQ